MKASFAPIILLKIHVKIEFKFQINNLLPIINKYNFFFEVYNLNNFNKNCIGD